MTPEHDAERTSFLTHDDVKAKLVAATQSDDADDATDHLTVPTDQTDDTHGDIMTDGTADFFIPTSTPTRFISPTRDNDVASENTSLRLVEHSDSENDVKAELLLAGTTPTQLFRRRWLMIFLFASYSMSNAYQWIHLNIIFDKVCIVNVLMYWVACKESATFHFCLFHLFIVSYFTNNFRQLICNEYSLFVQETPFRCLCTTLYYYISWLLYYNYCTVLCSLILFYEFSSQHLGETT